MLAGRKGKTLRRRREQQLRPTMEQSEMVGIQTPHHRMLCVTKNGECGLRDGFVPVYVYQWSTKATVRQ